jgi:hypothetical protein
VHVSFRAVRRGVGMPAYVDADEDGPLCTDMNLQVSYMYDKLNNQTISLLREQSEYAASSPAFGAMWRGKSSP